MDGRFGAATPEGEEMTDVIKTSPVAKAIKALEDAQRVLSLENVLCGDPRDGDGQHASHAFKAGYADETIRRALEHLREEP